MEPKSDAVKRHAMKFEFEYNAEERGRLDRLNVRNPFGPATFAIVWCSCFLPTALCLVWLEMWSVVITGSVLILMASIVPAIFRLRSGAASAEELPRVIELTPVGKFESCGQCRSFIKWDALDEVIETEDDFLITRNQRHSLLPKRVVGDEQLQRLRDAVALWRNKPEQANEPVEMYRKLFDSEQLPTWAFELVRDDLVNASKSLSIAAVDEARFSFRDVEGVRKSSRWFLIVFTVLCTAVGGLLLLAALPPNRFSLGPMLIFICFNPLVLLFAATTWIRWKIANSVPRFNPEPYAVRLFDGGWALGNEKVALFNGWNEKTAFFIANRFIGIRSDLGLIHVLPMRGFDSRDGVWQFLDRAIRLKKNWLCRKTEPAADTQKIATADNVEPYTSVNPYRSPKVSNG